VGEGRPGAVQRETFSRRKKSESTKYTHRRFSGAGLGLHVLGSVLQNWMSSVGKHRGFTGASSKQA